MIHSLGARSSTAITDTLSSPRFVWHRRTCAEQCCGTVQARGGQKSEERSWRTLLLLVLHVDDLGKSQGKHLASIDQKPQCVSGLYSSVASFRHPVCSATTAYPPAFTRTHNRPHVASPYCHMRQVKSCLKRPLDSPVSHFIVHVEFTPTLRLRRRVPGTTVQA